MLTHHRQHLHLLLPPPPHPPHLHPRRIKIQVRAPTAVQHPHSCVKGTPPRLPTSCIALPSTLHAPVEVDRTTRWTSTSPSSRPNGVGPPAMSLSCRRYRALPRHYKVQVLLLPLARILAQILLLTLTLATLPMHLLVRNHPEVLDTVATRTCREQRRYRRLSIRAVAYLALVAILRFRRPLPLCSSSHNQLMNHY